MESQDRPLVVRNSTHQFAQPDVDWAHCFVVSETVVDEAGAVCLGRNRLLQRRVKAFVQEVACPRVVRVEASRECLTCLAADCIWTCIFYLGNRLNQSRTEVLMY